MYRVDVHDLGSVALGEEGIQWRFGGKPDYALANLKYLQGKTKNHAAGSLELIVENLVKTWEMETWMVNMFATVSEANEVGNYNVLLSGCPAHLYDSQNTTWEQSHEKFHHAFAAFPWELLEVFSGPPKVAFTWRHWGEFTGSYEGNKGQGELLEMFGFGVATVDDKLRLVDCEVFYKPETFIEVLRGERPAEHLSRGKDLLGANATQTCPYLKILGRQDSVQHGFRTQKWVKQHEAAVQMRPCTASNLAPSRTDKRKMRPSRWTIQLQLAENGDRHFFNYHEMESK
eukprot:s5852_g1.t1